MLPKRRRPRKGKRSVAGSKKQTPDKLAKAIKKLAKNVKANTVIAVKKAAIAIDQKVITSTPVDTGRARYNWLVKVGQPDTRVLDTPGSKSQGTRDALTQGREATSGYKLGDSGIYITNNLPYIERLNNGYSAQAPAGMVERAIQAGKRYLAGVELLKKPKGK